MTYSKLLLGTDTKKTKLSWFEYIIFSCIQQGWYNCWYSFQNWKDLVLNNYQEYALLKDDDPLEMCIRDRSTLYSLALSKGGIIVGTPLRIGVI